MNIRKIKRAIFMLIIFVISLVFIYPLFYTVLASLKTNVEIFANPFGLPEIFQWGNYYAAWFTASMGIYFKNSVILTAVTVCGHLLFGSMAAYVIARFQLRISGWAGLFFTIGMMIPIQSILIPIAKMAVSWGMTDNWFYLLCVYIAGGLPSTVFIMSNYLGTFPTEIEEAAVIDGCSMTKFYVKILVPISKPIFVTMGIMSFISTWNELLVAMVLLETNTKKTLPLGLMNFSGAYSTDYAGLCAAIMITVIPTIIIYLILQENVEKGLSEGAVKG